MSTAEIDETTLTAGSMKIRNMLDVLEDRAQALGNLLSAHALHRSDADALLRKIRAELQFGVTTRPRFEGLCEQFDHTVDSILGNLEDKA